MARILFVEDEAYVMRGMINSLESKHELTLKTTGSEALGELRQNHEQYDLVVLDLMLPRGVPGDPADEIPRIPREQVGEFVFEKMEQICPSKPTIILTAVRSNMQNMRQSPNAELMTKPVLPAELLVLIDSMLQDSDAKDEMGGTS